jgi:hypothetical protein
MSEVRSTSANELPDYYPALDLSPRLASRTFPAPTSPLPHNAISGNISSTPKGVLGQPPHLCKVIFTMPPSWKRLIRFESTDGKVLRGEPILPSPDFDVGSTTEETGLKAKVISVANNDIFDPATKVTDEEVTVKKLLGPVTTEEVPIIRCIGLNFKKHSTLSRIKNTGR